MSVTLTCDSDVKTVYSLLNEADGQETGELAAGVYLDIDARTGRGFENLKIETGSLSTVPTLPVTANLVTLLWGTAARHGIARSLEATNSEHGIPADGRRIHDFRSRRAT